MFERDTEAEVFATVWPGGYIETFEGYVNIGCGKYVEKDIAEILSNYHDRDRDCLEIGPGAGLWTTKYLIPNFRRVTCLDVVQKKFDGDCNYIQVPSKDFSCAGMADNSIDFLFSFGVFCHLSSEAQAAYLKSAFRKLKQGGKALVMFANFGRHPYYKDSREEDLLPYKNSNPSPDGAVWLYMDLPLTKKIVADAGFIRFKDLLPDFRDTLAHFEKP